MTEKSVPNQMLDLLHEFENGGALDDSPEMWGRVGQAQQAAGAAWKTADDPPSTSTVGAANQWVVVRYRTGGFAIVPAKMVIPAVHDRWAYLENVLLKPVEDG